MRLILLLNFCSCIFLAHLFKQNSYSVIHHFAKMSYVNESFFDHFWLKNVKPNRTFRAFDVEFLLKQVLDGNGFKARVQCYWFLSNEYKRSPILFDVKICDMFEKNTYGMTDFVTRDIGNLTKCPIKPGLYVVKHFTFLDEKLPPNFPERDYKVEFTYMLSDAKLFQVVWYGAVKYKLKLKK